jgi:hypothetical protein
MTAPSLSIALHYAARGFSIFPCLERAKEPATNRGFYAASTNPATIRNWFGNPLHAYNIAIRTGLVSGVAVFDIDGSNGAFAVAELELIHGPLPVTLTAITSAGCHLYFRISEPLPCSYGRIGPNLDVKACGGYVMAPPSIHPDGPVYRWGNDAPIAPIPAWLAELARKAQPPPRPERPAKPDQGRYFPTPTGSTTNYGRRALNEELHAIETAPAHTRNGRLNRSGFLLFQLVAGGELDEAEVEAGLWHAAEINGLIDDPDDGPVKTGKTIASCRSAGLASPRRRLPR